MMAEYNYQKNLKLWRLGSSGFKTPDRISYYYLKDHIGNIRVTVNEQGDIVTKDDYYPFGLRMLERSVNPDLSGPGLSYNNGNENDRLKFQLKRLQDYGNWKTYYFGWRDYDPELSRWFVVDPERQFASPYVAMGNNPIVYYDEDGQIAWFVPVIIGATIGGYSGYKIGEAKGAESWKMFEYIAGGAIISGFSGYLGAVASAGGGAFANTGAIIVGSYSNSIGMSMLSGGKTDISISFGFFSYNFNTGNFGYLGEKGNSSLENFGYFLGSMANLSDAWNLVFPKEKGVTHFIEKNDPISHSALIKQNTHNETLLSFGPDTPSKKGIVGIYKEAADKSTFNTIKFAFDIGRSKINYKVYYGLKTDIIQANGMAIKFTSSFLRYIPYQAITTNCANMSSLALWISGIPNIGIHPYILHYYLQAYKAGLKPELFSYYLQR